LLGQWFCHVAGLGYVLPEEHVRQALRAVVRHNFKDHLDNHESCQRTYALNDEAGLLLCSWPRGGRPAYPFPYADEVWTGIEYQVAAHCLYEGLLEEGLAIVKAVRDRHDGLRRNPWDEFECGHHYARAMASWSVLLALSGYQYNALQGRLRFAPKVNAEDFRCLFTTGTAWGVYHQRRDGDSWTYTLEVREGAVSLRALEVAAVPGAAAGAVSVRPAPTGGTPTLRSPAGGLVEINLGAPVAISPDATLVVTLRAG
jgi:hypothetical protein